MASVLSLRCNRKRQTNVLAFQPTQLKQNRVNNTQQWRDKWWQYQASLPTMEHFTWKQPSNQDLIFAVVMLFWYRLRQRLLYVKSPWHSPARNPTVYMPPCESRGICLFSSPNSTSPSSSPSSTCGLFHPDEIATGLRIHIDLLGVSNHWGSGLFFPLLVLFAELGDGSLCQRQAFLLLIDVDLIKILLSEWLVHCEAWGRSDK